MPADGPSDAVECTVTIDDRTVIEVTGDRDLAVVVRSASGEAIYLPPTDLAEPPEPRRHPQNAARETDREGTTAYAGAEDRSSYRSTGPREETPYDGVAESDETGLVSTRTGIRIVHPEPVVDLRLLR